MTKCCTCPSGDGSLRWPCPVHPTEKCVDPAPPLAGYVVAQAQPCQHRIAVMRNSIVRSGYMCVECGALFSAADHDQPRPAGDRLWDQTLSERDYYHRMADRLANAIAKHFGMDIDEYSSANCPWLEALDEIENADPSVKESLIVEQPVRGADDLPSDTEFDSWAEDLSRLGYEANREGVEAYLRQIFSARAALAQQDAYKSVLEEWVDKTDFIQEWMNSHDLPVKYLGWHRADVMRDLLAQQNADAERYRGWRKAATTNDERFITFTKEYRREHFKGRSPTIEQFDAGIDYALAAIDAARQEQQ